MNDRELLEAAAKAADKRIGIMESGYCIDLDSPRRDEWNPLTDDGDALRLAVKLNMGLDILGFNLRVFAHAQGADGSVEEPHGTDPYAATRRAIVRAAAEIGISRGADKE